MKRIYITLILIASSLGFQNCYKENRILKKLVGTWNITEFNRAGGYTKTDFSSDVTTFEFIHYKKAYTRTLKAVYKIDYTDPLKTDMIDTFRYEIKSNELDISFVQKSSNNAFLRKRFKIEEYKNNKFKLSRIDSTDLYIKATK